MLSIIFATLTFLLGISIGNELSKKAMENVFYQYENIKTQIDSAMLSLQANLSSCDLENLNLLGEDLDRLGSYIDYLEKTDNIFKDETQIQLLKSNYFNLEFMHYLLANKIRSNCKYNYTIILFFYDDEKKCSSCRDQGYQLIHLKKRHPYEIYIYSFDIGYDLYFIKYWKRSFSIEKAPVIVIYPPDGSKIILKQFEGWQTLEKYINEHSTIHETS